MRSPAAGWLLLGAILFVWGCNGGETFEDPPTMPDQPTGEGLDQPPMDQPPLDQPPLDQPPADQSLLDEPSEPLVFEDFEDAPSLPPAPPEDLPSDTELPGVAEDDLEQLDQLSPFEQPADLPADDAELPMFPPDEDD